MEASSYDFLLKRASLRAHKTGHMPLRSFPSLRYYCGCDANMTMTRHSLAMRCRLQDSFGCIKHVTGRSDALSPHCCTFWRDKSPPRPTLKACPTSSLEAKGATKRNFPMPTCLPGWSASSYSRCNLQNEQSWVLYSITDSFTWCDRACRTPFAGQSHRPASPPDNPRQSQ